LVWISFDPQSGPEQTGRRPGLVLSPAEYNQASGLALACPITSRVKGYPFEVAVSSNQIQGVVLADQLRSLDWRARPFAFVERAGEETVEKVQALLSTLLQIG
jgi:mRNA interferase MazF